MPEIARAGVSDETIPNSVHDYVIAASWEHGHAIAIRDGGLAITYETLRRRANALAMTILAHGVTPGSVVAVRMRRSTDQIVSLLGVLLSGSAFVVIDPDDPLERQEFMIRDSGCAVVLARATDGPVAPTELALGYDQFEENFHVPHVGPGDLAYLVYTSGTSGTPNAVEITHDNLLNFIDWTRDAFAVRSSDRASYCMGLSFDAAQSELWPYLCSGASIDVVPDDIRTSADRLRKWLITTATTIGTIPMSLAEQLISATWPEKVPLRYLLTGGDVLRAFPRQPLPYVFVNNYGPSECTIIATSGAVPFRDAANDDPSLPTIGKPIRGVSLHLLDEAMRPVPKGAEGEIWIGGRCVGKGYRGRPVETAARFRRDVLAADPHARLYRTGDRARQLPNGEFAFCGRTDTQVKIRGVRIELDEIAAGLQRHPGIGSAVVIARDDDVLGRHLIAYLASAAGHDDGSAPALPDASEIREFLRGFLPSQYIPGYYVGLAILPMTRNGKIDFDALPPLELKAGAGRPPETETELLVADVVEALLRIDSIAASDDFFLIGGHSLLATQVIIQCREEFDVELTLRDLFETPTIEGIAAKIDRRIAERDDRALPHARTSASLGSAT